MYMTINKELIYFDNIKISNNAIKIGDPEYLRNYKPTKINKTKAITIANHIPIKNGIYKVFFEAVYPENMDKKIMKLYILSKKIVDGPNITTTRHIFTKIGIDTGRIIASDIKTSINDKITDNHNFSAKLIKNGIMIRSGLGDGIYDVFVHKYNKSIIGIEFDFYSEYAIKKLNIKPKRKPKRKSTSRKSKRKSTSRKPKRKSTSRRSKRKSKRKSTSRKSSKKSSKKSKRKGPTASATKFKIGTRRKGNDGYMWKIIKAKNGVKRWQRINK